MLCNMCTLAKRKCDRSGLNCMNILDPSRMFIDQNSPECYVARTFCRVVMLLLS